LRYLLDTQLVLWWLTESQRTPQRLPGLLALAETPPLVSRVSQWELAIKLSTGKIELDLERVVNQVEPDGFQWLEITSPHLMQVARLPFPDQHRDPFDRLLVAQALTEPLILLTTDRRLAAYGPTIHVLS
jgi:PIN domain nuclease of toxin-antitoxin system